MIKVVFVCLGNICRSPMAEVIFKDLVKLHGLSDIIQVDSAATSSWEHGNPVHPGTQAILDKIGLSSEGLTSRPLAPTDFDAEFIIGMDDQNIIDIKQMTGKQSKAMITKLLYFTGENRDIADPYYTGDYDQTYKDVLAGTLALLEFILNQDYMVKHGIPFRK